jgi:phosphatidylserine decarboxylase
MLSRLFAYLQYILPKYWITSVVYRMARIENTAFKDFLITRFIALYDVDIEEVLCPVPEGFASFNDFFIRELQEDARPIDPQARVIVSPVDGTVSSAGAIKRDSIFQAKGLHYSLDDLLATDLPEASRYIDGEYATIYLAPYNYHRVHAPFHGELVAAQYVPGDLFSVNAATAAHVPGLFRRNERLVMHFRSEVGPYVLILVGALNVGSISTPWTGELRPRKHGVVESIDLGHGAREAGSLVIDKGALLGWFNMGSTVVVLFPENSCAWNAGLETGATVRTGEAIGAAVAK